VSTSGLAGEIIDLEPLGWGVPIILLNSRRLEIQGPVHHFHFMGKDFDSSWVAPTFRRVLSVRLIIERTIIIIVPLFTSLLLVINPVTCISIVDDIVQIPVITISPSAVLLRWSQTVG
jgi:hypothetical protein